MSGQLGTAERRELRFTQLSSAPDFTVLIRFLYESRSVVQIHGQKHYDYMDSDSDELSLY